MAQRSRRIRVRIDPRFLIGIFLVTASVLGVWLFVGRATRGVGIYVAKHTIVVGDPITAGDLATTQVRIGRSVDRYLTPEKLPSEVSYAASSIQAGEFVPRSAVASDPDDGQGRVVVAVAGPLPSTVKVGRSVVVWAVAASSAGDHAQPRVVASRAVVVAVTKREGIVASDTVAVELQVPTDDIAALLEADANANAISLIADRGRVAE
ncbi:MAG TPA: SAF domain-containing protein [Microbacteriaceae bacterium]|nr:SAF domain-containing protein [Microbacteriaceae bacterium]